MVWLYSNSISSSETGMDPALLSIYDPDSISLNIKNNHGINVVVRFPVHLVN